MRMKFSFIFAILRVHFSLFDVGCRLDCTGGGTRELELLKLQLGRLASKSYNYVQSILLL